VRLATWNVNSARARTERIVAWVERSDVDVVALQETKCKDDQFPTDRFAALGYGARFLRPVFARASAWRIRGGVIASS